MMPPAVAAWRHVDVREGFEVLFLLGEADGFRVEGHATGVEDGAAWGIRYEIALDADWATRSALVVGRTSLGPQGRRLESDGSGAWLVDGSPAPHLDGCLDVDLEASACTNALPIRRLALEVGERAEAPAAYVRALDLRVDRLEQSYARLEDEDRLQRYDYASPAFDFAAILVFDEHGLIVDYPGIAVRAF
jgi:hypothetical protein